MNLYENDNGEPLFSPDLAKLAEERDAERRIQLRRWKEDFKDTFTSTPHGRRVLWWLMHETYMFRSFTQYNASAYGVLAKQELGNDILSVLTAEAILQSLIEVKKEAQDV